MPDDVVAKSGLKRSYEFTKIFPANTKQGQMFDECVLPLITDIFNKKKNALVFSYGVTNSGKTYTIIGQPNEEGMLPMCVKRIIGIKNLLLEDLAAEK